ncbi:MAG TPA: hypothetical protein VHY08_20425 [Bacillota bacterium]|nr:hypothetical protein [Bacillota bacterium]
MNRDILAGIICFSLIFLYNGLLKTNLSMKWILWILGTLFGISIVLASRIPIISIQWLLSLKTLGILALIIFALIILYRNQKKTKDK